jgi:hypothetical protein
VLDILFLLNILFVVQLCMMFFYLAWYPFPRKRALISIQPPGNTLLLHYKVGNYDTIFLNFFYQFLKWLLSIWNYRTSCSTNQQWRTCQKVLGRHENARRQQNTIHYIPPGNHVSFFFFSFSISWFQNLWLALCWTYTRKPKIYNFIYIYFCRHSVKFGQKNIH